MSKGGSILPKKLIAQLVSTVLFGVVMVLLFFSVKAKSKTTVSDVRISINSLDDKKFLISKADVKNIIDNTLGFDVMGAELKELNLMTLEKTIQEDRRVKSVEIFVLKDNSLIVEMKQRVPMFRISDDDKRNYYMDEEKNRIPHVKNVSVRVPVVTGNIDAYEAELDDNKENNLNTVYTLIKTIQADKFLKALIEQVHIESNRDIVLVPKMGRKKIILGDLNDLDDKLFNLKTYYRQGTKKVGLDKFAVLDLRYKNQVVGRT